MKLDEALQHRWAGKDIKRKGWCLPLAAPHNTLLDLKSIDADDWEVAPKYVDYLEAIKALIHGDIIRGDHKTFGRAYYKLHSNKQSLMQRVDEQHSWTLYGVDMPTEWLTATNFEIVED